MTSYILHSNFEAKFLKMIQASVLLGANLNNLFVELKKINITKSKQGQNCYKYIERLPWRGENESIL